jgi:hypothetical protein
MVGGNSSGTKARTATINQQQRQRQRQRQRPMVISKMQSFRFSNGGKLIL